MDIKNIDNLKDKAEQVVDQVASNKEAKKLANSAINEVEKKLKVDIPDVDGIKKILD